MLLREIEGPIAKVEGGKDDGEDDSGNNVDPLRPGNKKFVLSRRQIEDEPERELLGKVGAWGDPGTTPSSFPTTSTLTRGLGQRNLLKRKDTKHVHHEFSKKSQGDYDINGIQAGLTGFAIGSD